MLSVEMTCLDGQITHWDSQSIIKRKPVGNLLLATSILFTGNTFASVSRYGHAVGINLPFLVHHSQNAFIKGRSIFDAIRTIDDILEYAKRNNRTGILVAIDFEKAFDSLNRTFLVKVLQKFNFGIYFSQWIQTFYTNLSSCVLNNSFTTNFFSVSRRVRQGDPLSPLLFILSLEILACYIRQDRNIHGLVINNEEIKLTLFADDVTCFLRDRLSYLHLLVIIKFFSRFSGLSVNDDKT